MDQWDQHASRAENDRMRHQLADLTEAYEQQRTQLAEIQSQLDAARIKANSADRLVTVTVDSAGVVTDVWLDSRALRKSATKLGNLITEVAQDAARQAQQQATAAIAPLAEGVEGLPDLPDLIPGAPSLRDPLPKPPNDANRAP